MQIPIMMNPIIKQLGKSTRYHKVIGYGKYGVALDTNKEVAFGLDGKKYKAVTIISSQYSADTNFEFALIKKSLRKQGVHVLLSGNFEEIPFSNDIQNEQVKKEINDGMYFFDHRCNTLSQSNSPRIIQYDEEWAPGVALEAENMEDLEQLYHIPDHHYKQLFTDAYKIINSGLFIDTATYNILYDKDSGFWFIDLEVFDHDKDQQLIFIVQEYLKLYPGKLRHVMKTAEQYLTSNVSILDKLSFYLVVKKQAQFCERITTILEDFCKEHKVQKFDLFVQNLRKELSILQSIFFYYDSLFEDSSLDLDL